MYTSTTIYCESCSRTVAEVQFGTTVVVRQTLPSGGYEDRVEFRLDEHGEQVQYVSLNGLLSLRKRLDGKWGIQCDCGANTLLHPAEEEQLASGYSPTVQQIEDIKSAITDYDQQNPPTSDVADGATLTQA